MVSRAVWQDDANETLNEAFFGKDYKSIRSAWIRLFEALNNRRTMSRLRRARGAGGGALLEVGVGSGSLLTKAKDHGYAPVGCDLSAVLCHRVEKATGIRVHYGSLEALPEGDRFDVIVMNHVLEHVSDPLAVLGAARRRLKPMGVLHVAVPNVGSWEARLPGWNSYEPYHLLYFTPRTLQEAAQRAGLETVRLATHESFSGWFLAILRTILRRPAAFPRRSKLAKGNHSSPLGHAYRAAMVACGVLTTPIRRFQEVLGNGDEVVLIARQALHD